METMNHYKAFGLMLQSECEFDELLPCDAGKVDIIIKKGKVPDISENIVINTPNVKIGKDNYWSNIENVAKFYVEHGRLIILEPYENASFEEMKLYIFGSCMGAALYQRRILPLHASAVNVGGKGILLTGEPGAGKSTIAAVIYRRGYKILTDDVTAVASDSPLESIMYPGYPGQKLWEDAIERIGIKEEKNSLNRITGNLDKYSIKSNLYYEYKPIPIRVITEIIPSETNDLRLEEIKGGDKLVVIMKNTYRKILVDAMDLREWYFRQCVAIAANVIVYRITRPQDQHLEQEIANLILETIS